MHLASTVSGTYHRLAVGCDSYPSDHTRTSGSHPTCLCCMRPILHGSLLVGRLQGLRHPPWVDTHPLAGNENVNDALGDKQNQTKSTCFRNRH